jgi:hypothetical protein
MKKLSFVLAALLLALLFSGCVNAGNKQLSFKAVVLELSAEGSVLAEALEGEDVRKSSDLFSFSVKEIHESGVEVGDIVEVFYDGTIAESYPAQLRDVSLVVLEKVESPLPPIELEDKVIEYDYGQILIRMKLPEDWSYSLMVLEPGTTTPFGIGFWSNAEPDTVFMVEYNPVPLGICGTGVTFTDMKFTNYNGTACTETIGEDYWFFFIVDEPYVNYTITGMPSTSFWAQEEAVIMAILDSIEFGVAQYVPIQS